MSAEASSPRRRQVERWMPGVRVLRTYERSWLSRDLSPASSSSPCSCPQGMAYAELSGLPAITGLYTTVVCLVAYALVGPSPILVLGPDSSLGPMIAATILPLAAGNQEQAIALAGMLALLVGADHRRRGRGQARLRRRPALEPGPDRATWRASRSSIFVGQLPKLFGFSTDASGLVAEAVGVPPGPRPDEPLGARHRPAEPRHHPGPHARRRRGRPASSSPSWSRSRCRSCSTSRRTACP